MAASGLGELHGKMENGLCAIGCQVGSLGRMFLVFFVCCGVYEIGRMAEWRLVKFGGRINGLLLQLQLHVSCYAVDWWVKRDNIENILDFIDTQGVIDGSLLLHGGAISFDFTISWLGVGGFVPIGTGWQLVLGDFSPRVLLSYSETFVSCASAWVGI